MMSRKNIRIIILILIISTGLLAISEGFCDISLYINGLYNKQIHSLNQQFSLVSNLHYPIGTQMPFNPPFGLVNLFNGTLSNNGITWSSFWTFQAQMEAGMNIATEMFDEFLDADPSVYENRIIFLTDAMPNTGQTSDTGLLGMTRCNADNMVFSTFIGIGVDFNTELIELITKIRGANYYSVHSSAQFKNRMVEEFEYNVNVNSFHR